MKVGRAIYHILSNDATVLALITEDSKVKVFPLQVPQQYNFPAVVYTPVSNIPNPTKDGMSGFDQVRVQIDIYSRSYSDASDLDNAVRSALDFYNSSQPVTINGVTVRGISYINTNETLEEEDNVYRVSSDYQIIIEP